MDQERSRRGSRKQNIESNRQGQSRNQDRSRSNIGRQTGTNNKSIQIDYFVVALQRLGVHDSYSKLLNFYGITALEDLIERNTMRFSLRKL